jgi:glutamyl-tRNA synthetase
MTGPEWSHRKLARMADSVRVRFSPAPTGFLHVGSARTALFNWLFARHHGGTFIVRIEDTDVARSREEWITGIQETLLWLGLEWDEGPVLQSRRFDVYLAAADRLVAEGNAYECFCTEDEVRERNEAARREGRTPGYDGRCRSLTAEQRAAFAAEGRPRSIRFRTPDEGVSRFVDVLRGEVAVDWSTVHDFVIVRSDGTPLFFLANAVDDIEMEITHVIRGEDLIDSTHRVLALRTALGHPEPPVYAHLPLIVGKDRAKLSKRHGAIALEDFRERGYLPEALVNYLALLGWAPDDGQEIVSRDDLVAMFDLDHVNRSAAFFDYDKLDWMNAEYIRAMPLEKFERDIVEPALQHLDVSVTPDAFHALADRAKVRITTTMDLEDQLSFLVEENKFTIPDDEWARVVATERAQDLLDAVIAHLEDCEWTLDAIDLRPAVTGLGLNTRKVMPALYVAIEGRAKGLPLHEAVYALGRERSLGRLRAARGRLAGGEGRARSSS